MNELQFGIKVRQVLNHGTELGEKPLSRLRAARELALARQRLPRPAQGLVWVHTLIGSFGGFTGFSLRLVLPMAVLVGGLLAIDGWQLNQRVREVEEIDALLLTDELPLDAFLDKGFETWLKKRSAH